MIIFSPEISGSLKLAEGAVIENPIFSGSITQVGDSTGEYSGSFSGSINGLGDPETFSASVASDFSGLSTDYNDLQNIPSGILSSSTEDFSQFSASVATDFSNLSSDFDELTNNPFTQSASEITVTKTMVPSNGTIDLGKPTDPFRDLYLSSASLYIDGQKVLSSDSEELLITTDVNQSLKIQETSNDTVSIETDTGDITLQTNANIALNGPIVIGTGHSISVADSSDVVFTNGINVTGNATIGGNLTVQGTTTSVDSTTVQIGDNILELNGTGVANGGLHVADPTAPNTDTGSLVWDSTNDYWKAGTKDNEIKLLLADGDSVISGSSQVDLTQTTNYSSGIVDILNQEAVVSGSVDSFAVTNSTNNRVITSVDSSTGNAEANLTFDGSTLTVNGTIVETSARQYKDNITSLGTELHKVLELNPVSYTWKGEQRTQLGFIADEVSDIYPELLNETESGIQYSKMVSVLTKAIQDLHEVVVSQEQRLKELENN